MAGIVRGNPVAGNGAAGRVAGNGPADNGAGGSGSLGSRSPLGGLNVPLVDRVTPRDLGDFLSLPRRGPAGSFPSGPGGRPGVANASFPRGGPQGSWRGVNLNQVNVTRIQTSVRQAWRNDLGVVGAGRAAFNRPYWNGWAGGVRGNWRPNRYYHCFTPQFWATNYVYFPWPRFYYWWTPRPWTYWWSCPTWSTYQSWFPSWGWTTPYSYDYGPGGNVVFSGGYVYLNDQPIATAEEYAASAAALAEVPPPANPEQPAEWLPLGTFAVSEGEEDKDPSRVLQLAVDQAGNVSGTLVNQKTGRTYPVQGRVDKETQRVAFTIGDNKEVVLETGLYNLTQQQTPVLAHGEGREETYLLLRLEPPPAEDAPPAPPAAAGMRPLVP
jgi:hypothetical protein